MSSTTGLITFSNNSYLYSSYKTRKTLVSNDKMAEMMDETDKLQTRARKLKNYKTSTHQESKLIRNINNFVKEYNAVRKKAEGIEDPTFQKKYAKLVDLVEENKKALKKVGVTVGETGGLGFDSTDFDKVKKSDLEKLFSGTDSFIYKANKKIRDLKNYAGANLYSEEYYRYKDKVSFSPEQIQAAKDAVEFIDILESSQSGIENFDINSFIEKYNKLMDLHTSEDANIRQVVEKISELTENSSYTSQLNNFGISVSGSDHKIELTQWKWDVNKFAGLGASNFNKLFAPQDSYRAEIENACLELQKGVPADVITKTNTLDLYV